MRKTNIIELKKIMIDKNISTINELSRVSGINRNTLGDVMSGKCQPSSNTMVKLVDALEIPLHKAGKIFFSK